MSILRRKMFRGGGYAHRGTGITSGLTTPKRGYVDRPGSYQGIGESSLPSDVQDKWQAYYDMLKGVQGERAPFDRFDANVEPLMTLFGNWMQGTSYQPGLAGALEIGGKGLTEAAPGFGKAIREKRAYEAATGTEDASLRMKALDLALRETPKNEVKDSDQVYGTFGTGTDAVKGYGFATTYKDGTREYEIGGKKYNSFTGLEEPEAAKPETFFKGDLVKIRKKNDPSAESFDALLMSGNKGSTKFNAFGEDFNTDDYEIIGDLDFEGNVKVKVNGAIKDGTQVWDGERLITRVEGKVMEPGTFEIVETEKQKPFEDETYKLTIGGKEYETQGIQQGMDTFIIDPRPDSTTQGKQINIKDIDDLESFKKVKTQPFMPFEEQLRLQNLAKEDEEKLAIATDAYKSLTAKGDVHAKKIANYNKAAGVLGEATTSSFAPQRAGFMQFLELMKVNQTSPGIYNAIAAALDTNNTVATEVLNAAAQQAFIANAQEYDDRLNQTEVRKLAAADFSLSMSAEGSQLLIDVNRAQSQIFVDGSELARLLASGPNGIQRALDAYPELTEDMIKPFIQQDGRMKLFDVTNIADQYVTNRLINFGNSEEIKNRIASAIGKKPVGDQHLFDTYENRQTQDKTHIFNPGDAYRNKQIKFLGYPQNGEFVFDDITETGLNNNKPVYAYDYDSDGDGFPDRRVILQF